MSSETLEFILLNDFGFESLLVNARLETGDSGIMPLIRAFGIGKLNNAGRIFGFRLLLDFDYLKGVLTRLGIGSRESPPLGVRS